MVRIFGPSLEHQSQPRHTEKQGQVMLNIHSSLPNHRVVRLAMPTRLSMTGTSTSTPTMVASTTGDDAPNSEMATATESSKKFDAPIMPPGAAESPFDAPAEAADPAVRRGDRERQQDRNMCELHVACLVDGEWTTRDV